MTAADHPRCSGVFFGLERHFADFMESLAGGNRPELWLAAALLCRRTAAGHLCMDLRSWSPGADPELSSLPRPAPDLWLKNLKETPVVGAEGGKEPLILDKKDRLYLNRYWNYERKCAEIINEFISSPVTTVEDPLLKAGLRRLFPDSSDQETDWQQVAAAVAVLQRFSIITGGPGSGKTTIVIRVLLLLLEQCPAAPPRILLAAPTGKAAARLRESIRFWKEQLAVDNHALPSLPDEVFTLHRLLGFHPFTGACRFDEDNPLPCDVLVIDEASMVDLPLLVRVLTALPREARLILLGDRHQLASVEAGAVLSDLCGSHQASSFSPAFADRLRKLLSTPLSAPAEDSPPRGPLADSLVFLHKSHRFDEAGGIGRAARLIKEGKGKEAAALFANPATAGCRLHPMNSAAQIARDVVREFSGYYRDLFDSPDPATYLRRFSRFSILCALRQGPFGAEEFNSLVTRELVRLGLIPRFSLHHHGRPVMITSNDYRLGLFNGDIGVIFRDPDGGRLQACFATPEGGIMTLSPARLPAHETAFAMTIHKSQGSEFDTVFLLLPPYLSELLTRELIYTGLTRARKEVTVCASLDILVRSVERRLLRGSGLGDRLRP